MFEVSLVVALVLLQQCNSKTSRFLSYWTALAWLADNNLNKQHFYARNNKTHATMVFRILLKSSVVWELLEDRRASEWGPRAVRVRTEALEFISRTMKTFDYRASAG
jgi:hypothetical protein